MSDERTDEQQEQRQRKEEEIPVGHEVSMVCTAKCNAPNDAGPSVKFEVPLDENPDLVPWPTMREIAHGRLRCTINVVASDGKTGSLIDKPFNATGDAGKVGWDGADRVLDFGISFKNGDEGKHHALDLHKKRVQLVMQREGDAGAKEGGDGYAEGGDADDGTSNMFDEPDPEAWRREPVTSLKAHGLKSSTIDALAQRDINTLGDLAQYQAYGAKWYDKVKGVGESAAESIEQALRKWRDANPSKCPDVAPSEPESFEDGAASEAA